MVAIESEMATGRFGLAARNLVELLAWKPDSDKAAYLLGVCEQARGRNPAAAAAWARVTPGSAFAHRAILGRMRLFHDRGRFAAAEQLIHDAAEDPRHDRSDVRVLLVPMYSRLGRLEEAERLIEDRWEHWNETGEGASEQAIDLVRMHLELTFKATPIEDVRTYLDHAAGLAPEDDRVWLGRGNLAIRTGAYDQAQHWLDACLRRRAEDVPVWDAWLNWGLATHRLDVVQEALAHLPAADSAPARLHRLRDWLAAQRGDVASEVRELERTLVADPANRTALERLAQLAANPAESARAAELHRRKAETDDLRARYEKLYDRKQPVRDAEEMAHLAEQLGRTFEARGFLTVAIAEDPDRDDLRHDLERLSRRRAAAVARGQTWAEVLADELGNTGKIHVSPWRAASAVK
jgi:tetratricopeptide (TPR) repeat protein